MNTGGFQQKEGKYKNNKVKMLKTNKHSTWDEDASIRIIRRPEDRSEEAT